MDSVASEPAPPADWQCPDCGGDRIEEGIGDVEGICPNCGLVVRDFESGPVVEDATHDHSHDTDTDDRPQWLDHYSPSNATEQQVRLAVDTLDSLADDLSLSDETKVEAARRYGDAAKAKVTDGRSTVILVAATLHLVARSNGEPRPLAHVVREAGVEREPLAGMTRKLQRELEFEHTGSHPEDYLDHLARELGLESAVERATNVIEAARTGDALNGKSPPGVAGAALYLASDSGVTQREVARTAGVTKETIRVRLNALREAADG
jgi:transcription initiation factor TFIIIB Brf1 subunit/transcription initiation factor TFIIB